jgi:hypothetical protein
VPGKGLLQAFGLPEDSPTVKTCFGGATTGGDIRRSVDSEKGGDCEGDGPPWGRVDCGSGRPPASFGSGLKQGETCTFILEFEGDAVGTTCLCELVEDPKVEIHKGGEYCRRGDEDADDISALGWSHELASVLNIPSSTCLPVPI